jgi:N-acyl-phosphatidylethanolamine-hydrolysing phospholipase D
MNATEIGMIQCFFSVHSLLHGCEGVLRSLLLCLCLISLTTCRSGAPVFSDVKWQNDVKTVAPDLLYAPHYKDGKFFNPWMPMEQGGLARFLSWKLSARNAYTAEEKDAMPEFVPGLKARIDELPTDADFIAWIGHTTFLIRAGGEFWLTDPMFSHRALLPRRHTPPALSLSEVNALKGRMNIVISHNHYDHFDKASLAALPRDARVFVPLGLGAPVAAAGKSRGSEMDWWQTLDLGNGTTLVCLPAQHWSSRISQGTNETLWASFLLITPNATIYIGGDSGYFIGYKEFGKKFPGIDYALISVGAYHPRWFMHYAHLDVREAIQATEDMGAKYLIPAHWGAFQLGDEPIGYPLVDLKRTLEASSFDASRTLIMGIGELIRIPGRDMQ